MFCADKLKEGVWMGQLMEFLVTCLSADNNPYEDLKELIQKLEDTMEAIEVHYPQPIG